MNSEKRQKLIDSYLAISAKPGDRVVVRGLGSRDKSSWGSSSTVVAVKEGGVTVEDCRELIKDGDWKKWEEFLGDNPFSERRDNIRNISFSLDSILSSLFRNDKYNIGGVPVATSNFNPFVYNAKGEKEYYQRPLVWSLENKRLFLDSLYAGIDLGKILVRNRSWKELENMAKNGETCLAFKDVVDGQQRLSTLKSFVDGEFCDNNGFFFGDFNKEAQNKFNRNQLLSYSELPEDSKDSDVICQFLRLNFCGVPQSKSILSLLRRFLKESEKSS